MKNKHAMLPLLLLILLWAILLLLTACKSSETQILSEGEEPFNFWTGEEDGTFKVYVLDTNSEEDKIYTVLEEIETKILPVTSEYLRNLSWEEMKEKGRNFQTDEDSNLEWLIWVLANHEDKPYLSSVNGFIRFESSYEEMRDKLQVILDVYNASNKLQIKLYHHKVEEEENRMAIQIISTNAPVTSLGQTALLKDVSFFYESSRGFGFGRTGMTIEIIEMCLENNPLLPEDFIVTANGVSYLTEDGEIEESIYVSPSEVKTGNVNIPIDRSRVHMLHFCDENKDIGWVLPEALMRVD